MVKKRLQNLRNKSQEELLKKLRGIERELYELRAVKATAPNPAKTAKIRKVKKKNAGLLLVLAEKQKEAVRQKFANTPNKLPKDLRPKLTKKMRQKLSAEQLAKRAAVHSPKLLCNKRIKFALDNSKLVFETKH